MSDPIKVSIPVLLLAIFFTAIMVGVSIYFWQEKNYKETERTSTLSVDKPNETNVVEYKTMTEYIEVAFTTDSVPPRRFIRVEVNGEPIDVKITGASAPIYVYAQSNWNTQDATDVQPFYLKAVNPMYSLEEEKVARTEFWYGPFYGKLKSLIL